MDQDTLDVFNPTFLRDGEDLQNIMLSLLKGGLNKQARDAVGLTAAQYVNRRTAKALSAAPRYSFDETDKQAINSLRTQGYANTTPVFSPKEIEEIRSFIAPKRVDYGSSGFDEGGRKGEVLFDALPENVRFAHYNSTDIRSCPQIYRAVHDPRLINIASGYLGAPATISSVSLWWSFPSSLPAGGMQMFHHDRGDFRSCNLFVYLTDVSELSGPHSFVERTHEMNTLYPIALERFGQDATKFQKFWNWMEVHRKSDDEIREFFHESDIKVFTGAKGTSFLEDTRGLHKATLPIMDARLAFEIVYSVLPKFNEAVNPLSRNALPFTASSGELDPMVKYATRIAYR